ncbi:hypothetical protein BC830DRAFT_1227246 [Chytriomyces sp. MP71]|nr:hypothetical protein BC830DRAFT_1227246 [Chytriomyces sp. MP71]
MCFWDLNAVAEAIESTKKAKSIDFLDITDPKAVLENAIGQFSCLTQDGIITSKYNGRLRNILIVEAPPGRAMSKGLSVIFGVASSCLEGDDGVALKPSFEQTSLRPIRRRLLASLSALINFSLLVLRPAGRQQLSV